jgi:hypothetical protein
LDRSQSRLAVRYTRKRKNRERKEAMLARFDHRPMLTAALALATIVLVAVVVTLSALLITSAPTMSPPSVSGGGNPAAGGAANPADRMDAGGKGYGMPIETPAERMDTGGRQARVADYPNYRP